MQILQWRASPSGSPWAVTAFPRTTSAADMPEASRYLKLSIAPSQTCGIGTNGMEKPMKSTSTPQTRLNRAVIDRALKAAAKDAASGRAELQSGKYKPAASRKS